MSDVNPRTSKNWLANFVDKFGTAIGAKERGLSERIAGGMPTANTGKTAQSKAAGLDDWVTVNHNPEVWTAQNAGIKDAAYTEKNNYPMGIALPEGYDTGGGDIRTASNDNPGDSGPSMAEIIAQQRAQAKLAYESGLRKAQDAFNRAQGMHTEAMGILGTRRGEFENAFNQGNQDITQEYQKRGGELGTSAQNRKMSDLAALQAMGLNGSAVERAQNIRMRDQVRAQSELMDNRNQNQVTNKNVFDTNNQWALGQEGAINRALEQAESDRRNAEGFAYENYLGNTAGIDQGMRGYMDNILQHQQAMQAAGLANQNYQAGGFTPSLSDFSSYLQPAQAKAPQATAGGDQASNISLSPYAMSELDKLRKSGVYGGGLYNNA